MRLHNKVSLVIGGNSDIGRASAELTIGSERGEAAECINTSKLYYPPVYRSGQDVVGNDGKHSGKCSHRDRAR